MEQKSFLKKDSFLLLPFLRSPEDFQLVQGGDVLPRQLIFDSFFFLNNESFIVNHYEVHKVDVIGESLDYTFYLSVISKLNKSVKIYKIKEPQLIKFITSKNFVIGETKNNQKLYVFTKQAFQGLIR